MEDGIDFATLVFPFRSPRGHFQSLKVSASLFFCCTFPFVNKFPRLCTTKKALLIARLSNFGWKMGFEPTTFGTTIRHSNRLSYIHHVDFGEKNHSNILSLQPPLPALSSTLCCSGLIPDREIECKSNTLFDKVQIFLQKVAKKSKNISLNHRKRGSQRSIKSGGLSL